MDKTTAELIEDAYKEGDPDKRWDIIFELHSRGSKSEFDATKEQVISDDAIRRELGADILGRLEWRNSRFRTETIQLLISLLQDSDENVVYTAAVALGHRGTEESIPHLVELKKHKSANIRLGVIYGLTGQEHKDAINTLIELSNDPDFEVRSLATFGLGTQCAFDTPELRKALKARLTDEDSEIRGEAIVGLANRKDKDIVEIILKELETDDIYVLTLEAAALIADKKFLPSLKKWKKILGKNDGSYLLNEVNEAIEACS